MAITIVKHEVKDFGTWKRGYDDFASFRKEGGVMGASVHRDLENPNMVTVIHKYGSLGEAQAFISSDDLKEAMGKLGVIMPPEIWIGEDVESTPY